MHTTHAGLREQHECQPVFSLSALEDREGEDRSPNCSAKSGRHDVRKFVAPEMLGS
jgi:hypothetical protein